MTGIATDRQIAVQQRSEQRVSFFVFCIFLFFGITHLIIGSNFFVVLISLLTLAIALYPVIQHGINNFGRLLIAILAFRYIGVPLIAKLLFHQPLDANLIYPLESFLLVLIGLIGYTLGLWLVNHFKIRQSLLQHVTDLWQLQRIMYLAAIVGVIANLAVSFRFGKTFSGITYANFFAPFLHLALITSIAVSIKNSDGKRVFSPWVIGFLAAEFVFAFSTNQRMRIVDSILILVITTYAFHGKIRVRYILTIGLSILIFASVITPIMLYVRAYRLDLTWTERIAETFKSSQNLETAIQSYENLQQTRERFWFLGYYGTYQNILERVSLVSHVDTIKTGIDVTGMLGWEDIHRSILETAPRVIAPNKPLGHSHGDWVFCQAGIICQLGNYLTVPLIANAYAAFGRIGVFAYSLGFAFFMLIVVKKSCGLELSQNIWAIYFFIRIHNQFVEGGTADFLSVIFRFFPQDLLVILIILYFSRPRSNQSQRRQNKRFNEIAKANSVALFRESNDFES